jgi:cell division protein FtsA
LVITGGGAQTPGLKEVAKKVLRMPLRAGHPAGVTGLIDEVSTPAYASSIGLVIYGSYVEPGEKIRMPFVNTQRFSRIFGKVVEWGRSFLP